MLARKHRLAVAGLVTAAAIAAPTAALASGPSSPSTKPSPPGASSAGPGKSPAKESPLPALAAKAGISVDRLQAGLVAMKRAGGDTPAGIAAFAAAAGVTSATAHRVADAVFGTQAGPK